jgi:hypothetical protein
MGWWGTGVLEGDPSLDVLCHIETLIGHDDLYPLEAIDEPDVVARLLVGYPGGLSKLAEDSDDSYYQGLSTQVVGVVAMAVGAVLGDFADKVRAAARDDDWAGTDSDRRASMDQLVAAVDGHAGRATIVPNRGLFDAIADLGD